MSIGAPTNLAGRLLASVTAALIGLAPHGALACGLCTDAIARRSVWWASSPLAIVAALGAEAVLFSVYGLLRRQSPRFPRTRVHLVGLGVAVAASLLSQGSGLALATPFALALGYSFVRSLLAERELGRVVLSARLGLVAALLVVGLARSHPAVVPTGRLVGLCLVAPTAWDLEASNWVERELRDRAGAAAEIERRFDESRQPGSALPTRRELALLRLHMVVGGPAPARVLRCEGWELDRYERNYGAELTSARVARTICSAAPD